MKSTEVALNLRENCSTPERHPNPAVKVRGIAYLVFHRPDIEAAAAFFTDFGLRVVEREPERIHMRAAGPDHHCIVLRRSRRARHAAIGFYLDDASDLQRLRNLPDASPIEDIQAPGGGQCVRFMNPDGVQVDAIYGRANSAELKTEPRVPWNIVESSPEGAARVNETVRIIGGPARVHRLGHTVQSARDVDATIRWYQERFGLIVSDFQFADGVSEALTAFMRCDRGAIPTDHHTLAIGFAPVVGHLHSAFECRDLDDLMAGHVYLRDRRRRHSWGIGRHMLGSQIFDYWRDPWGDMFEHYTDGDLFDAKKEAEYFTISGRDSHHQWGPPMTRDFLSLTADRLLHDLPEILGRFVNRRDPLTPGKLMRMARGMSSSRDFHGSKHAPAGVRSRQPGSAERKSIPRGLE